ncbi:hypothetical protein [Paenibacillus sp. UNCCL117]|nr:hypothetical protein [Paenibacillus sp. UNCCL117]
MLLVFGLFALGLILILGYAFYEHSRRKRLDKQAAGREAKPS